MFWIIFALLAPIGVAIIVWLIFQVRASARRLDERIEEYHEEGPPRDPYSELAQIIAADRATRPGGRRHRHKKEDP